MTLDEILDQWIPYRLQAIETLGFALRWLNESEEPSNVEVQVDGRITLRGNVAAFANPMIEAGLIHARALLEFMGLCVSNGRLSQIKDRRKDDIAIEHYSTIEYPLSIVKPEDALAAFRGPSHEAEAALLVIFYLANKGIAHFTAATQSDYTEQHLDIAIRGIPVLIQNHLYSKLGRRVPAPPST